MRSRGNQAAYTSIQWGGDGTPTSWLRQSDGRFQDRLIAYTR